MNIRIEFEQHLQKLQDDLLLMGSMVDTALEQSMIAMKNRDNLLARQVIAGDANINQLRYRIEAEALLLIARQQPVATDLRTIIAVMNVVTELERIGDHAAGVAKIAVEMSDQPPLKPLIDLPRMNEISRDMLKQSLDSFVQTKKKWAKKIIKIDRDVDQLYEQILRELLLFMIEDPHTITRAMYLLFAAHHLERVADYITNICEHTFFRATGKFKERMGNPNGISLDDLITQMLDNDYVTDTDDEDDESDTLSD